ncbi:phytase [uncultured Algimonas sp.]|uniref:phytase n=1 Tax=uncultured Algimonas sp. TaxID=1547920 RepID=UPI00262D56D1|nr:phytase [uncultured Algimonas sp.]
MRPSTLLSGAVLLTACATTPAVSPTQDQYPAAFVAAAFETPVMASEGDSADDPAIWIGADGAGFIAGTDKQSGLYIYNLDGTQRDYKPVGMVNNVDLRSGFLFDGREHVLLVMSNDEINVIETMLYDPSADRFFQPEGGRIETGTLSPYGICLGQAADGHFHAGVTTKSGRYEQFVIGTDANEIIAEKVRELSTEIQTEGCVFDDRMGSLYLAQEEGDLYRYPAAPGNDAPTLIAKAGDYGMLADLEGVTVYEDGGDGGYLLVSSQGNDSYAAFSLPDHAFAGRFAITAGAVDGVSTTDGIAATSMPTARFPQGFLVVQDDMDDTSPSEPRKKQNFKIVDWRVIDAVLNAN